MAAACLTFLTGAVFAPPSPQTQNSSLERGVAWWLPTLVGFSSFVCGFLWWFGLRSVKWSRQLGLETKTRVLVDYDSDLEPIQKAVVVEHMWKPRLRFRSAGGAV